MVSTSLESPTQKAKLDLVFYVLQSWVGESSSLAFDWMMFEGKDSIGSMLILLTSLSCGTLHREVMTALRNVFFVV